MSKQIIDQLGRQNPPVHGNILSRLRHTAENLLSELCRIGATWRRRRRHRRQLAHLDDRSLKDLAIRPSQADFEIARKPWQEDSGLGKSHEIGSDCAPIGNGGGIPRKRKKGQRDAPLFPRFETLWIKGHPITLRPVASNDKQLFGAFMQTLSDRSRRLRFLVPKHELNSSELRFMSEVDQDNHVAWVAIDAASGAYELVAEARFVKLSESRGTAEYAITVADAFQGRGLGGKLMQILAQQARENGIFTLRGTVAADNTAMLGFLRKRGANINLEAPGVLRVDVPVAAVLSPSRRAPVKAKVYDLTPDLASNRKSHPDKGNIKT